MSDYMDMMAADEFMNPPSYEELVEENRQNLTIAFREIKKRKQLEAENAAQSEEAETRMPVVRGLIIDILASKDLDELVTPTARDILRTEILTALNEDATEGGFRDLYFTEYLVQ